MNNNIRSAFISSIFLVLSACTAGIAEFRHFDDAYDRQFAEGARVLDRLAAAERVLKRREIAREQGIPDFDPDHAAYYLQVGDPPLTGAIRASLDSVNGYNAALSGLATGEAAEVLTARIGTASTALAAAAGAAAAVTGAGTAFAAGAQQIVARVLPVFQQLATIANRAAFRRQLLAAYPDIRALLVATRAGTPEMFDVMRRSYVERGSLGGTEGISAENLVKLEQDRELLAGWVILLDRTLVAMDAAARAAREGGSRADLAALVEATFEIRVLAETIRGAQSRQ